jgi:hypothetical protein
MVMCPPVVSVAGFANVDRGLFTAVSNLTKELVCCKKQVRLILLSNSVTINLQICRGGSVLVRHHILIYCTSIFTHISVRAFLWIDGQKLGVLVTAGILLQRVPMYEKKHYIYAHAIFCNELSFTKKIIPNLKTKFHNLSVLFKRTLTNGLSKKKWNLELRTCNGFKTHPLYLPINILAHDPS